MIWLRHHYRSYWQLAYPSDFLLVSGVNIIVLCAISSLVPLLLLDQSAFATFPGENGKIAFSSMRGSDWEIYVMNADGSEQTRLTNDPDSADANDYYAEWSPDGSKIVFSSSRDRNWEIYVMNADGSNIVRLTNNAAEDSYPSWSPDGSKIVFSSYRDGSYSDGNSEIYVMNADGSNIVRLTNNVYTDKEPQWSPDGSKIVFTRYLGQGGALEIYVMNADGSEQTRLTNDPNDDASPSWSPDGSKISFQSSRDRNWEIYVMNADGSNPTRLTSNSYSDYQPVWSPDGKKMAFNVYIGDGNVEIYVMNADGSERTNISNNPALDGWPDWAPIPSSPSQDTTPPLLSVPDDMVVEATGPDGAQVSFEEELSATDDVDGPVDVTCNYSSGDTFPIGGTVVTCTAEDAAGNSAEETFTITVQDTTVPDVEVTQVVDRRNRVLDEGDTTPTPYIRVTFEATDAVGVEDIECSLDGQGFTSCTSPVVYDRLSRGSHQVTVRAVDEEGNTGEDRFLFTIGSPSSTAAPGRQ